MKLYEIIQSVHRVAPPGKRDLRDKAKENPRLNKLGSGRHADVYQAPNRPHEATKVARPVQNKLATDGAYVFKKALIDSDVMAENPYFPRIYGLNAYPGKDSSDHFTAQMEKLIPIEKASVEELESIIYRILQQDVEEVFPHVKKMKEHVANGAPRAEQRLINGLDQIITQLIYDEYHKNSDYPIDDTHFVDAIAFIRSVSHQNPQVQYDVGPSNYMMRRTPYGLQLVITDPLS